MSVNNKATLSNLMMRLLGTGEFLLESDPNILQSLGPPQPLTTPHPYKYRDRDNISDNMDIYPNG